MPHFQKQLFLERYKNLVVNTKVTLFCCISGFIIIPTAHHTPESGDSNGDSNMFHILGPKEKEYLYTYVFVEKYFSYFAMKTCGYSLEAPHRGTSNKYLQHMFFLEIRKIFSGAVLFLFYFFSVKVSPGLTNSMSLSTDC